MLFLLVYPGTESFEVVILNNQVSTQVAEAELGRWRLLLEAACVISMYQILNIGMLYVVL